MKRRQGQDLFDRAVEIAKSRPTLSVTNLKSALGCTEPLAKSFVRIMKERRIIGDPVGDLARYPSLVYTMPEGAGDLTTHIDLDVPERSTLAADATLAQILDGKAQAELIRLVEGIKELEDRKDVITDGIKALYEMAKAARISAPVLKKVVKAVRKQTVPEMKLAMDLATLYLHTLGELIEDEPVIVTPGARSSTKH